MSCDEKRDYEPTQHTRVLKPFSDEQQRVIDALADRVARLEGVHHPVIVRHR